MSHSYLQDYIANVQYFQRAYSHAQSFATDAMLEETEDAGLPAPDVLYSSPDGTRHMGFYQQTKNGLLMDFRNPTTLYQLPPEKALTFIQTVAQSSRPFTWE